VQAVEINIFSFSNSFQTSRHTLLLLMAYDIFLAQAIFCTIIDVELHFFVNVADNFG
jgi:hypothetical protein